MGLVIRVRRSGLARALLAAAPLTLMCPAQVRGQAVPPTWVVQQDDFEAGNLDQWEQVTPPSLTLASGAGHVGTTALQVTVGTGVAHLKKGSLARAREAYLTFWFHPNGVSIPEGGVLYVPDKSIFVAAVKGPLGKNLVGLRLRQSPTLGYRAFLQWVDDADAWVNDHTVGEFAIANNWQQITIGYQVDGWVAAWVNGSLVRKVTGVTHRETYADRPEIGKTYTSTEITPSGSLRYDEVSFGVLRISHLYVDGDSGDDSNDGLTAGTAFRTIGRASDSAGPGTTVHILTGTYREQISPALSGTDSEPVLYTAESGPGTIAVRGSERSSSLTWTQLSSNSIGLPAGVSPGNIYWADLSGWDLSGPPRFVVSVDGQGNVATVLPIAREPDWSVVTPWKHHEFWWAAEGGSAAAACYPPTDADPEECDAASRSTTQLTDAGNDASPAGIEAGNLTTVGSLVGGTLVALDCRQGNTHFRRTITAHDTGSGRVTVSQAAQAGGQPGLGWGSKYYVEGRPSLLDQAGEWWYDTGTARLYLWPPTPGNPAGQALEISRRAVVFDFSQRSYQELEGLTLELVNEDLVRQLYLNDKPTNGNAVRNGTMRYALNGVSVNQAAPANCLTMTDGLTVQGNEIAHMDRAAIYLFYSWGGGSDPATLDAPGITNVTISGNTMHHLGFRSDLDTPSGVLLFRPDQLKLESNTVSDTALAGVQFIRSVIDSSASWGFAASEIKTGGVLVRANVFERACQLNGDCGALRFWGQPPDSHVFRDVLITGNVMRDSFGWTWVAVQRGLWTSGSVVGMSGSGLYLDTVSGFHLFRNIAYNNPLAGVRAARNWRDGQLVAANNVLANSLYGLYLDGLAEDTHAAYDAQFLNNAFVNNEAYGAVIADQDGAYGNLAFDYDLFFANGWGSSFYKGGDMAVWGVVPNRYYQTVAEAEAGAGWEAHGLDANPAFVSYNTADHNPFDGSWPDFHLQSGSPAVDAGATALPTSLQSLLTAFAVPNDKVGTAFDMGRHELTITATHALTVTKVGAGTGTVTSAPAGISCGATCVFSFNEGTTVTLTATPSAGSVFAGWSGDCSGTGSCQVSMNSARRVGAAFVGETACTIVLQNQSVTTTDVHESCYAILAGPSYHLDTSADVTLRAAVKVVFRNGFTVGAGARLAAGLDPALAVP